MKKHTLPILFARSSTGKIKKWSIRVEYKNLSSDATIVMESGYEDSKQAVNRRVITKGKNIGKKNETTPLQQAISDATSKWNKKHDRKGYVEDKANVDNVEVLPMLAKTFDKMEDGKQKGAKKHIKYPCYVQPKLDGVRDLDDEDEDGNITHTSREGMRYTTLSHIDADAKRFHRSVQCKADGEMYVHGDLTFQEMLKAVKKYNENTEKLKHYIYDIVRKNMTFEQRHEVIKAVFEANKFEQLVYVPTHIANSEEEVLKWHDIFVEMGYEGIIIRNKDGLYKANHRSKDLQKHKNFIDEEFDIVSYKEATGEDAGTIVFICRTAEGLQLQEGEDIEKWMRKNGFECRPKGTREVRRKWLKDFDAIKGKRLTVRYQELTDSGKPRFPTGIAIRDYE